jgi:uncharacterized protein (DUF169 family)
MRDYERAERLFVEMLGLNRRPVAVAFRDAAPAGLSKFTGTEPSGCSFWRLAAGGQVFYTVPGDHYNCPVGSYTHNIALPPERQAELEQTLGLMAGIGYLRMEEIPGVPQLHRTPGVVIYAPLSRSPLDPDVVLFAGQPARIMLLQEAALRAGVLANLPLLARPTCMAIPAALAGGVVASSGCIGNRIYTGIGPDELYCAVPGRDLFRVADEVETIAMANAKLTEYHQARLALLRSE